MNVIAAPAAPSSDALETQLRAAFTRFAPIGDEAETDIEVEEAEVVEDEEALPLADGEEEEEEELIEDASELGEDEDDMAEVIDNVEEEES